MKFFLKDVPFLGVLSMLSIFVLRVFPCVCVFFSGQLVYCLGQIKMYFEIRN